MLTILGVTRVNEETCDVQDVMRAASDLVAIGCSTSITHIPDGLARLRFASIVSAYIDEVIQAVEEGAISAWQAVQEIRVEYEGLSSKAHFYLQNGVGVVAGVMQVRTGSVIVGASGGLGVVPGGMMLGHGVNNIYEGVGNIYFGPDAKSTVGPIRRVYQLASDSDYEGNMKYYTVDLVLSAYGVFRPVPRQGSVELFRRDPINYEMAYRQAGRLALFFEVLVDLFTIEAMVSEKRADN